MYFLPLDIGQHPAEATKYSLPPDCLYPGRPQVLLTIGQSPDEAAIGSPDHQTTSSSTLNMSLQLVHLQTLCTTHNMFSQRRQQMIQQPDS
jgi:hypothetical protein